MTYLRREEEEHLTFRTYLLHARFYAGNFCISSHLTIIMTWWLDINTPILLVHFREAK